MNSRVGLGVWMAATMIVSLSACEDKTGPSKSMGVHVLRTGVVASQPQSAAPKAKDVICQLQSEHGVRFQACSLILRAGQMAYGPYMVLAPGRYIVDFETSTDASCAGGDVTFDVVTAANGFVPLARLTTIVKAPFTASLPVTINETLGDTAALEFHMVVGFDSANCLRLEHVMVKPG